MTEFTCVPFAIVCPWARCVDAITSSGSSAAMTPDATASWPIATCRKPGSSPARKRSSTFSSKRRMSSISRKSSCSRSSESVPCSVLSSTFAIPPHYADDRMKLADQWRRLLAELPEDWGEVKLDVSVPRAEQRGRAAALLGPASPGRMGDRLRISVRRGGGGAIGPDAAARLLARLDDERIRATLSTVTVGARAEAPVAARGSLADAWDAAVAALPPDWSDLLCELELTSTDHVDRAALLLAPVNPMRLGTRAAFPFRVA